MAIRKILRSAKGQFLVFVAVAFVLLGVFVGLAIDVGRAYLLRSQLSGLVDAAALAAANVLQGQVANEDEAAKAACDSMLLNGMQVVFDGGTNTCASTGGSSFTVAVNFVPKDVPGGPPIQFVQVSGSAPMNTTFMRLAKFITGNALTSIQVAAFAEGGPERPVDLMLVLDRSGSMSDPDLATNQPKIASLKTAVNQFLNTSFSGADQIGMVSFARRGCGNSSGTDSTATNCASDQPLGTYIGTVQAAVNGLCNGSNTCIGGTNTMEALRTAGSEINAVFNDPARATSRKAVLLVTDGQPTFMRRFSDLECEQSPQNNYALPTGAFPNGCVQGVFVVFDRMARGLLSGGSLQQIAGPGCSGPCLYRDVIGGTRSIQNGAMFEANKIRNYGYNGGKDVVIFAIGIGTDLGPDTDEPQSSLDENARCLLARIANDPTTVSNCDLVYMTTADQDSHDDLRQGIPAGSCAGTPSSCLDTTQQQGKVFTVDLNGNVQAQLQSIFGEIAALLKLRLTI